MIEPIVPAVLTAKAKGGTDLLADSVKANVKRTVDRLRAASEPALLEPLRAGNVRVVGAYYTLQDGKVDFSTFESGAGKPRPSQYALVRR